MSHSPILERLREWAKPGCRCARCSACRDGAEEIEQLLDRLADQQAQWGYSECIQTLKIERLTAALESMIVDPPATLDEPDRDAEVIFKMRAIAAAALAVSEVGIPAAKDSLGNTDSIAPTKDDAIASGWQPFGTVPKDGTLFLAYDPDLPDPIWMLHYEDWKVYGLRLVYPDGDLYPHGCLPTHWMSLPAPPALMPIYGTTEDLETKS